MPRTAPGLRTDTPTRLAELGRQHPEWRSWIALLGVAERALHDAPAPPPWRDALLECLRLFYRGWVEQQVEPYCARNSRM